MADAQAMTIPEQAVQEYKPTINELLNELKCRLESPPEPDLEELRLMCDAAIAALEPAATCNESLQVESAAPEAQLAAFLNDLSGENGELIDRMAAAIRDWGSHYDDGPWETLSEDRKDGWRGDAERALAVVKEYLTTHVGLSGVGNHGE